MGPARDLERRLQQMGEEVQVQEAQVEEAEHDQAGGAHNDEAPDGQQPVWLLVQVRIVSLTQSIPPGSPACPSDGS